ncbi:MAG: hypothetical protein WCI91_01590 [Candidatus Nomurabacteria bacterium]
METTILVIKVLGIYMMSSGLLLILKKKSLIILLKDFYSHPALIYLTSTILIFLSSIYLLQYNIWDGSYKTIVTVIVWLTMVKGLSYIFIPEILNKISVNKYQRYFVLYGLIAFVVGLYLFTLK